MKAKAPQGDREPFADRGSLFELLGLVRRFWWLAVLSVPFLLLVTLIHETAHAAMAVIQGGTLTEFVWWPSGDLWGYVRYEFPLGLEYSSAAISLAPYGAWLLLSLGAVAYSYRHRRLASSTPTPRRRDSAGAVVFAWFFVLPVGDVAHAAFPYLLNGKDNDWASAFGPPSLLPVALATAVCIYAVGVGYGTQRRLLGSASLSLKPYLTAAVGALLLLATPVSTLVLALFN